MAWYAAFSTAVTLAGLAFIVGGSLLFLRQRRRMRRFVYADGTVIELIRQRAQGTSVLSKTEEGKVIRPNRWARNRGSQVS